MNKNKKKKNAVGGENKENIDIDEIEAETTRMLQDFVMGEKRTVSDNTRPIHDQSKNNNVGIKVLVDKTNNLHGQGNAFVLKRPVTQMMTERGG